MLQQRCTLISNLILYCNISLSLRFDKDIKPSEKTLMTIPNDCGAKHNSAVLCNYSAKELLISSHITMHYPQPCNERHTV